ncbi:hypothetical protein NC651_031096 [Populus alba x Populus x berolinensis]|nr:hypothetical protein NC651_031096 [Populus alba x Populus x berolinensis]
MLLTLSIAAHAQNSRGFHTENECIAWPFVLSAFDTPQSLFIRLPSIAHCSSRSPASCDGCVEARRFPIDVMSKIPQLGPH